MLRRIISFDLADMTSADQVSDLEKSLCTLRSIDGISTFLSRYAGAVPRGLKPMPNTHAIYFDVADLKTLTDLETNSKYVEWNAMLQRFPHTNDAFFQYEIRLQNYYPWAERYVTFNLTDSNPADQVLELEEYIPTLRTISGVTSANIEKLAGPVPPNFQKIARSHGLLMSSDKIEVLNELNTKRKYLRLDSQIRHVGSNLTFFQTGT